MLVLVWLGKVRFGFVRLGTQSRYRIKSKRVFPFGSAR